MDRESMALWETVERLDVESARDLTSTLTESDEGDSDVLEVPDLLGEPIEDGSEESGSGSRTYEPGTMQACPTCGKTLKVRKNGTLGAHKCEAPPTRGERLKNIVTGSRPVTPKKVRNFTIAVTASGVESGVAHILARPFSADPDDVPSDLPDPDGMIGPLIDTAWPQIPRGGQKFIETLADNSDLIACFLAWADYFQTLGKWTREQRAFQQMVQQERVNNGAYDATGEAFGRVVPFAPA